SPCRGFQEAAGAGHRRQAGRQRQRAGPTDDGAVMLRWNEKDFAEFLARGRKAQAAADTFAPPFQLPPNDAGAFALGRLAPGQMNRTETQYAAHLAELQAAKAILWFRFEAIKLRLAASTFYSPDFLVLPASGVLEVHEVKGFWEDDARVK